MSLDSISDGPPVVFHYINPAAFFFEVSRRNRAYDDFLVESLGGRAGDLIVYLDECTPGL